MTLADQRRAIRHLLDPRDPADAAADYFAFHHPDRRTTLALAPPDTARAIAYAAICRTGLDLFRPLITFRLPADDYATGAALFRGALAPEAAVLVDTSAAHRPLIEALFAVETAQALRTYVLDRRRFEPIINIHLSQETSANGLPRFLIRRPTADGDREVVAAASLNWLSPHFGEIAVRTSPQHRREGWGRSVVAALAHYLVSNGRTPLYVVDEANNPSRRLAQRVGFVDSGADHFLITGQLRPY